MNIEDGHSILCALWIVKELQYLQMDWHISRMVMVFSVCTWYFIAVFLSWLIYYTCMILALYEREGKRQIIL